MGQTRFEAETGLSRGYLSKLKNEPSPSKILSIVSRFPELNKDWLLTGEGEMLNTDVAPVQASDDVEEVTVNSHGNRFMQTPSGMLMEVPVVPFAAMGSPLDEFAELIRDNGFEHVSFPVDGVHHGSYYAFRVEGDSMDDGTRDSFQPGDIVLVRELDRFIAYEPTSQERQEVKDCFLVSCYTGLAYVDLFNVDFAKRKLVQGHWLVYNHRQKTNERNTIVLLPIVLDILKKYDFKLPHRSNVGYNRQLSILCKEMELGKNLTTHCARHTFATTVCLGSGIPIQVVQRMLGHSNIHTTEIYTHMTETDLIGGYDMIK